MTLTEILSTTRKILEDTEYPYLWADEELVSYINDRLLYMDRPITAMSLSSPSAKPEIPRRHTRTLINGGLALAYEKTGPGTLNPEAAKIYRELWSEGINDIMGGRRR